jgi:uncharacterized protein (DUF924 family)
MADLPDAPLVRDILDFWFSEEIERQWFSPGPDIDREITERFGALYDQALAGKLDAWKQNAESALALILLLDQFPRNMFRGTPKAFGSDAKAQEVCRAALDRGFDQERTPKERHFFYLPLMHSENLPDQAECVELYRKLGQEVALDYAIQHHDIIARFGRFPHRNKILGRETSEEEQEFLKTHKGF